MRIKIFQTFRVMIISTLLVTVHELTHNFAARLQVVLGRLWPSGRASEEDIVNDNLVVERSSISAPRLDLRTSPIRNRRASLSIAKLGLEFNFSVTSVSLGISTFALTIFYVISKRRGDYPWWISRSGRNYGGQKDDFL
jgi:hypothetical protein